MERAAGILVPSGDGRFLGVSRKNDHNAFGIPGGKCDAWETDAEAAVRETMEEVPIELTLDDIHPISFSKPDGNHIMSTFIYIGKPIELKEGVHEDGGGYVKWVTEDELMNGPFTHYNKDLLLFYRENFLNFQL